LQQLWLINVFFALVILLYTPKLFLLILFAVSLGYFVSLLREENLIETVRVNVTMASVIKYIGVLALIATTVVATVVFLRLAFNVYAVNMVSKAIQDKNVEKALKWSDYRIALALPKDLALTDKTQVLQIQIDKILKDLQNEKDEDKKGELKTQVNKLVDSVIELSERAAKLNSRDYKSYLTVAGAYEMKYLLSQDEQYYNKAQAALNRALNLAPSNPIVSFNIARLSLLKKDVQTATRALNYTIQIKPNFAEAYDALFQIALAQKATDDAMQIAQIYVQRNPNNANAWLRLATVLYNKKDYKNAAAALQNSIAIKPQLNAYYLLALTYNATGNKDEALKLLKTLQKQVDDPNILKLIQSIQNTPESNESGE
jgi:tetratricopeptide (TPR) repeat protein